MDAALELLPADYWRYYLIANTPESDDTSFTWELFASQVNKDLADTLGNFVNRVLTFSAKQFGDRVPSGGVAGEVERHLSERIAGHLRDGQDSLDALQFRKAAQRFRAMWVEANAYLELKAPWQEMRHNPDGAALTLRTAMNLIYLFGVTSAPLIPSAARTITSIWKLDAHGTSASRRWVEPAEIRAEFPWLAAGVPFDVPGVLFRKISDEDVAAWRARFGGPEER
jgi:methionyl-tRNA synthetase